MPDYAKWVSEGQRVDMLYAQGIGRHGRGRVIGYTERPTLIIETDDGERITWIADMCTKSAGTEPDDA